MPPRSRGFVRRHYRENYEGGGLVMAATLVVLQKGVELYSRPSRRFEMITVFRCNHCLGGQMVNAGSILDSLADTDIDYQPHW
jgi:hypothetical protein